MSERKIHFNGQEIWRYTVYEDTVSIQGPDRRPFTRTFADIDPYTAQEIEDFCEKQKDHSEETPHWEWEITQQTIREYIAGQLRPSYQENGKLKHYTENKKQPNNRRNNHRNHNRKGSGNGRNY